MIQNNQDSILNIWINAENKLTINDGSKIDLTYKLYCSLYENKSGNLAWSKLIIFSFILNFLNISVFSKFSSLSFDASGSIQAFVSILIWLLMVLVCMIPEVIIDSLGYYYFKNIYLKSKESKSFKKSVRGVILFIILSIVIFCIIMGIANNTKFPFLALLVFYIALPIQSTIHIIYSGETNNYIYLIVPLVSLCSFLLPMISLLVSLLTFARSQVLYKSIKYISDRNIDNMKMLAFWITSFSIGLLTILNITTNSG